MDLIAYFGKRKLETEEAIHYAKTAPGFRLLQKTLAGEKDITAEHIASLERARDEYQKAIEYLTPAEFQREVNRAPAPPPKRSQS